MCTQDVPHRPPKCQSWHLENLRHNCQASLAFFFYLFKPRRRRVKWCQGTKWPLQKKKWLQMGAALRGAKSKREKKEKKGGGEGEWSEGWGAVKQAVDQSLQAWPLGGGLCSGRDHRPAAMLSIHRHTANDGAAGWHQVGSLIHPQHQAAISSSTIFHWLTVTYMETTSTLLRSSWRVGVGGRSE